jgi:transposase
MGGSRAQGACPRPKRLQFVLSYKRLERGRFAALWREDGSVVHLTASELALFIEGCDLVGRRMLSPGIVKPKTLALDRSA